MYIAQTLSQSFYTRFPGGYCRLSTLTPSLSSSGLTEEKLNTGIHLSQATVQGLPSLVPRPWRQ